MRTRHRLSFVIALAVLAAAGALAGELTSSPPARVSVTFVDNFNGPAGSSPNTGLSKTYWLTDPCWEKGCGGPSIPTRNAPSHAFLDGHGHLVLEATKGATGTCGSVACAYTSARLTMLQWSGPGRGGATFSQRYGTFSARIKVPVGAGLWPAFWMVGADAVNVAWPTSGEIDILEGYGPPNPVEQHVEYGTPTNIDRYGGGAPLPAGQSLAGWHVYSVQWSPTGISWLVDGRVTRTLSASAVGPDWAVTFAHPFTLILDLAVGGAVGEPNAATVFPAKMLVDWVRVSTQQ